ncbi:hypothetical protein EDB85DRAFT_2025242, partial [Lactarius pseudohatsudake]
MRSHAQLRCVRFTGLVVARRYRQREPLIAPYVATPTKSPIRSRETASSSARSSTALQRGAPLPASATSAELRRSLCPEKRSGAVQCERARCIAVRFAFRFVTAANGMLPLQSQRRCFLLGQIPSGSEDNTLATVFPRFLFFFFLDKRYSILGTEGWYS